jgi:AraC family transcriptional regulator
MSTQVLVRDYGARTSMSSHAHEEASLSIVVRGGFLERIGRGERAYGRGHVAFFPAGVKHAQAFGAEDARQVTFQPRADWIDYLADCKVALDAAPHASSAVFRRLGDRLLQEAGADDAFSTVAREGLVLEVVAAFGRSCLSPPPARPPAWLVAARDFLHAKALEPVSLAEVAKAAGRHEIHLAREFRRHFGASVGAYQRRLRTEHAAERLLDPGASLSDIAFECGFSSHAHLCREFKAQFGVTPSEHRAASRT